MYVYCVVEHCMILEHWPYEIIWETCSPADLTWKALESFLMFLFAHQPSSGPFPRCWWCTASCAGVIRFHVIDMPVSFTGATVLLVIACQARHPRQQFSTNCLVCCLAYLSAWMCSKHAHPLRNRWTQGNSWQSAIGNSWQPLHNYACLEYWATGKLYDMLVCGIFLNMCGICWDMLRLTDMIYDNNGHVLHWI